MQIVMTPGDFASVLGEFATVAVVSMFVAECLAAIFRRVWEWAWLEFRTWRRIRRIRAARVRGFLKQMGLESK